MRNISFLHTQPQIEARIKCVTRRDGWEDVKPGTLLCGVQKSQGIQKGELKRLVTIKVIDARRERLSCMIASPRYGKNEARLEGFPEMSGKQFVEMFCRHMKGEPDRIITRIYFGYECRLLNLADQEYAKIYLDMDEIAHARKVIQESGLGHTQLGDLIKSPHHYSRLTISPKTFVKLAI